MLYGARQKSKHNNNINIKTTHPISLTFFTILFSFDSRVFIFIVLGVFLTNQLSKTEPYLVRNLFIIQNILIRNGKTVWKHGPYCWYFRLSLNIWSGRTEHTSKQRKMVTFVRNCLVNMTLRLFSHFLLLWQWCQGYWGSSEDRYRSKSASQMLLICYYLLNSQNILINQ